MILLTGATGTVGRALLRRLTAAGEQVRCLVRDPRRLGAERVRVQIALGDLADPASFRHALRGVDRVVHLAASIRDQRHAPIEELNGVATLRLLRAAESAGVDRFIFFSAIGASLHAPARFFRAKALAEQAVLESSLDVLVFAPSLVYAADDPFMRMLTRMSHLPVIPVAGSGRAVYQPIWADDVAACVESALGSDMATPARQRVELAGPELLSYAQIIRVVADAAGRPRPLIRLPLGLVRRALDSLEWVARDSAFATAEEASLMAIPMVSGKGTAGAESLGVEPLPIERVLGQQAA
ncbi:MAG: NAD(P)H-binding protein [Thermoleophilaceae bacterium]|nr:NAD(P)H-binding protein [Thermoleophilaceae bacterium]